MEPRYYGHQWDQSLFQEENSTYKVGTQSCVLINHAGVFVSGCPLRGREGGRVWKML